MATEMHLVKPSTVSTSAYIPPNIHLSKLSELDRKMTEILQRTDISDQTKVMLYDDVLIKYKDFINKSSNDNTITSDITPSNANSVPEPQISFASIDNPKIRKQAENFYDYLKKRNIIKLNEMGNLLDQNENVIRGSNITDILEDSIRTRKRPMPPGGVEFFRILKSKNVPSGWVRNKHRLSLLNRFLMTPTNSNTEVQVSTPGRSNKSPATKKRKRDDSSASKVLKWVNL